MRLDEPEVMYEVPKTLFDSNIIRVPKHSWKVLGIENCGKRAEITVQLRTLNGKTLKQTATMTQQPTCINLNLPSSIRKPLHEIFCYSLFLSRKKTKFQPVESLVIRKLSKGLLELKGGIIHRMELADVLRELAPVLPKQTIHANLKNIYSRSSPWLPKASKGNHAHLANAIYYLADTNKGHLYIGKAGPWLGNRVTDRREKIPEWDVFRYDILEPQWAPMLEDIEAALIKSYSNLLKLEGDLPSKKLTLKKLTNGKHNR